MQKYNNRIEVPDKYKWDLSSFFKNEQEFEDTLEKAKKLAEELKKYKGCITHANRLYEFLTKRLEISVSWEDLYVYAYLLNDQELGNSENMSKKNATQQLFGKINAYLSFFEPELLALSKEEYEKIPKNKIELFKTNSNKNYQFTYNPKKTLNEQKITYCVCLKHSTLILSLLL